MQKDVFGFALLGLILALGVFRLLVWSIEVEIESGQPRGSLEQRRRTLLWYGRASGLALLAALLLVCIAPKHGMLRIVLDALWSGR